MKMPLRPSIACSKEGCFEQPKNNKFEQVRSKLKDIPRNTAWQYTRAGSAIHSRHENSESNYESHRNMTILKQRLRALLYIFPISNLVLVPSQMLDHRCKI